MKYLEMPCTKFEVYNSNGMAVREFIMLEHKKSRRINQHERSSWSPVAQFLYIIQQILHFQKFPHIFWLTGLADGCERDYKARLEAD